MNLSDLREELTAQADTLGTAPDLRDGVAAKVRQAKRRRAATAGVGASLAVAAIAVGVLTGVDRPAPLVPAGSPSSTGPMVGANGMPYRPVAAAPGDITKDGLRLRAHSADSLLAGGAIGDLGQRSLSVGWNPTTTKISLTIECYVPSASPEAAMDLMVRASIGSMQGYFSTSCSPAMEAGGDLPVGGIEPGPTGEGSPDVTVGGTGTLRVDLVDRQNRPVSRPDVRLVAAVYELGPQTEIRDADQKVAGVLPDTLEQQGYTYRLSGLMAGPVTDIARGRIELEAPASGPFLVTYGTVGIDGLRTDPAYYTLSGITGEATQIQEGAYETAPQSAGRGQWLTLTRGMPDLGTEGTKGTAFIATYVPTR